MSDELSRKVFISFRNSDGAKYKEELEKHFDSSTKTINCSEDQDRSGMSEDTIKGYLYSKLRGTSVTILILTPEALEYQRDYTGKIDDWIYDETRFSLEDRINNRTNGLIAVYTPEVQDYLITEVEHSCAFCSGGKKISIIRDVNNLFRKNMMNILPEYKVNKCENVFDTDIDSYCSLISWNTFILHYAHYIDLAEEKRENLFKYNLRKALN